MDSIQQHIGNDNQTFRRRTAQHRTVVADPNFHGLSHWKSPR
jgi:hypothetical protein